MDYLSLHQYYFPAPMLMDVRSPSYPNATFDSVPVLDTVAVVDDELEQLTVFAVNRGQETALALEGDLRGVGGYGVVEHLVLESSDELATNTVEQPTRVVPHARGNAKLSDGRLTASLPRLSWNVIRLAKAGGRS